VWIDPKVNARFPSEVLGLIRLGEIGDLYGGTRLRTDEVVSKDDWVVFVGQNAKAMGFFLVKMREGKGKVVGAGQ
jgi:hypothetical protein